MLNTQGQEFVDKFTFLCIILSIIDEFIVEFKEQIKIS